MAVEIYLGNPPENIRQWIIENSSTKFTFSGGQTVSLSIHGELANLWKWDDEVEATILDYDGPEKLEIMQLTEVDIGNAVTSIGEGSFNGCECLLSVTIPDSVTSIGDSVFSGCTSLASMTIPDTVTSIGNFAFDMCISLTNLTFEGKTLAQVQEMDNYPWGIEDTSIINVA